MTDNRIKAVAKALAAYNENAVTVSYVVAAIEALRAADAVDTQKKELIEALRGILNRYYLLIDDDCKFGQRAREILAKHGH